MRLDNLARVQARRVNNSQFIIDSNSKTYEDYLQDNRLTVCMLDDSADNFIAMALFNKTKNVYRDRKRRQELNSDYVLEHRGDYYEIDSYCERRLFESACMSALTRLSSEDRKVLERNADLKGRQQSTPRFMDARRRALEILAEECCL